MIFVTVGTQAPFDRLIEAVDKIAPSLGEPVVAQALNGQYRPTNIETVDFITPDRFADYFNNASLVVAHAGMGTIISALTAGKPLIVFPRLASLGEHRNEHQMATARRLATLGMVNVAFDTDTLASMIADRHNLDAPSANGDTATRPVLGDTGARSLTDSITDFILKKH